MKYLVSTFLFLAVTLTVLVWRDHTINAFADGRLICQPMPPAFVRPAEAPSGTPRPLALIVPSPITVPMSGAKIQFEPEPGNEQLALVRIADQADWGIGKIPQASPVVIASAAMPRPIIVPTPPPAPMPTPVVPNLYLPEGALNEEGAQLTLIKPDLAVYQEPDDKSTPAPFVLKEGDQVRPLTRLRNEADFDWIKIVRDNQQWWCQAEYFIRVDPRNRVSAESPNLEVGKEAVDKDSALPVGYAPGDMVSVQREVLLEPKEVKVRREVADQLVRMVAEALRQGVKLKVVSGFRDFAHQKKLYLEAIEKHGPKQAWVAAPGYSEHQLGTTIDISSPDKRFLLITQFGETPEGRWLHENAARFGFRNSYTLENTDASGYRPEPWHFRYVRATEPDSTQLAQKN